MHLDYADILMYINLNACGDKEENNVYNRRAFGEVNSFNTINALLMYIIRISKQLCKAPGRMISFDQS
jgi:hypothetical protein